jgi:hypothetical protein
MFHATLPGYMTQIFSQDFPCVKDCRCSFLSLYLMVLRKEPRHHVMNGVPDEDTSREGKAWTMNRKMIVGVSFYLLATAL